MTNKSLDEALLEFNPSDSETLESCKPITLWIPEDYKIRYDNLQKKSNRKFCKKLRELFMIAIDKTDIKTA